MLAETPASPRPAGSPPLLLNPREAAGLLGVSERTLRDLTEPRGDLPTVRVGRLVRYRPAALEAWTEARES